MERDYISFLLLAMERDIERPIFRCGTDVDVDGKLISNLILARIAN